MRSLSADDETHNLLVRERFNRESSDWLMLYSQCDFVSRGFAERQRLTLSLVPSVWDGLDRKALDIGCGAGLASLELASRGFDVTGIDLSEKMIALAREGLKKISSLPSCRFEVGDVNTIDLLRDHSLDVVVALGLLEYLPDQASTIDKIHRILKPGGLAVVTVPNSLRASNLLDPLGSFLLPYFVIVLKVILPGQAVRILRSKFGNARSSGMTQTKPDPQRNRYTPRSLDRLFQCAGFAKVADVGHLYGPFTFAGKHMFSDRISQRIDYAIHSLSCHSVLRVLQRFGANYIAAYRKREEP